MNHTEIIDKTHQFLEEKFDNESTGHDYWHMFRVWQLAKHIAAKESEHHKIDMFTLELAALLHDVADWKFHGGDLEAGPQAARQWLGSLDIDEAIIVHIEEIIRNVSFKGARVANKLKTIEGQIVYDADKLDSLGAIGIARTFAYGGATGRQLYDPAVKPELHDNFEAYKNSQGPTINHFYEKLLLLKDKMYTNTGKQIALHRHKVMESYLEEFYAEWNGKH